MVLLRGNCTRSIRWKVIVSSRRLYYVVSMLCHCDLGLKLICGERASSDSSTHINWKRILARSSALEASEILIAVSIVLAMELRENCSVFSPECWKCRSHLRWSARSSQFIGSAKLDYLMPGPACRIICEANKIIWI